MNESDPYWDNVYESFKSGGGELLPDDKKSEAELRRHVKIAGLLYGFCTKPRPQQTLSEAFMDFKSFYSRKIISQGISSTECRSVAHDMVIDSYNTRSAMDASSRDVDDAEKKVATWLRIYTLTSALENKYIFET